MNQNEIINYLCNTPKYIQYLVDTYHLSDKIDDSKNRHKTLELRINECAQRCTADIEEFNKLMSQYIDELHANQTK